MVMNNASFALSELQKMYRNQWIIITPAKRRDNGSVVVWDLVDHFQRKRDAKSKLEKLRKSGLQNAVLYWCKPCQCNIRLVGKEDEDIFSPSEVAEFFRQHYGVGV